MSDDKPLGKVMQARYGAEDLHAGMRRFDAAVKAHGLSPREAALRWIHHHSALGDGDGVILGASRLSHVADNVTCLSRGRLPQDVLAAVEEIWAGVEQSRGEIL